MDSQIKPNLTPKQQYRTLKRRFKFLVYENECYQEQLRNLQRKLLKLSRDKNFLLDRLQNYEKVSDSSDDSDAPVEIPETSDSCKKNSKIKDLPQSSSSNIVLATAAPPKRKRIRNKPATVNTNDNQANLTQSQQQTMSTNGALAPTTVKSRKKTSGAPKLTPVVNLSTTLGNLPTGANYAQNNYNTNNAPGFNVMHTINTQNQQNYSNPQQMVQPQQQPAAGNLAPMQNMSMYVTSSTAQPVVGSGNNVYPSNQFQQSGQTTLAYVSTPNSAPAALYTSGNICQQQTPNFAAPNQNFAAPKQESELITILSDSSNGNQSIPGGGHQQMISSAPQYQQMTVIGQQPISSQQHHHQQMQQQTSTQYQLMGQQQQRAVYVGGQQQQQQPHYAITVAGTAVSSAASTNQQHSQDGATGRVYPQTIDIP